MGRRACREPQSMCSTAILLLPLLAVGPVQNLSACTVQLYLYSPYWPYGLYRSSLPVQYSYNSTTPIGRTACTEPQCLCSTAIPLLTLLAVPPVQSLNACTVDLYFYSPYWPTACTEPQCLYSRAITLLPLLAVRPVQCLSACTVQLYLYSSYWPTACTEPQCLYSRTIPLLPLLAVGPVQSLSACTVHLYLYSPSGPYGLYRSSGPVQYSYNSTTPIGRTAYTEPQCLCSTAIPLLPLLAVRPV